MKQIAESGSTTRKYVDINMLVCVITRGCTHASNQACVYDVALYRFCWLAVVVIAFTVFFYAVGSDLVRYYEYNSRIEVVKSHEESLPFPRVTLCNTNPYKWADDTFK